MTAAFARTGQGSQADADRAQAELAVRKNTVAQAAAQTRVASARLVELRNLGLGEAAARQGARSRLEQAKLRQIQLMDRVAREIVESHAQSESLRGQIAVAQSGIAAATDSYRRNVERIRGGQGLPIEVLQSIQALDLSRREYLRAVTDYSEAQFRLYRALGWPIPREVSGTQ